MPAGCKHKVFATGGLCHNLGCGIFGSIFLKTYLINYMPKVSTSDFRNGLTFRMDSEIYTILEFLHVKPGKGGAFVRTKLKGVTTGKVLEKNFRAGETVESVRVERRPYQYLYNEGDIFHFMHQETFEQITIPTERINRAEFMKESETVTVVVDADQEEILYVDPPDQVVLEITSTEPGVRGDTAQGGNKPAELESGATIQVPLFINEGDQVKVDTRTSKYLERIKS